MTGFWHRTNLWCCKEITAMQIANREFITHFSRFLSFYKTFLHHALSFPIPYAMPSLQVMPYCKMYAGKCLHIVLDITTKCNGHLIRVGFIFRARFSWTLLRFSTISLFKGSITFKFSLPNWQTVLFFPRWKFEKRARVENCKGWKIQLYFFECHVERTANYYTFSKHQACQSDAYGLID